MKIIQGTLFFVALAFPILRQAQTQTNEINSTGKVGIGTTTPTAELEVNGDTKIDGDVIVKDSVTVDKNMTIKQDVKVRGDGTFTGLLKAKSDMKVLGTTKMKGDGFVEGTFKFKGLADPLTITDRFVLINKNGLAKSGSIDEIVYNFEDCHETDRFGGVTLLVPNWAYTPGVIYTGSECPASVGIRTPTPNAVLDVRGTADFIGTVGIGGKNNAAAQLLVESDKEVGLCVRNAHLADFGYGVKAIIDRDNTKAFAANDSRNGEDVFRVYGDGRIEGKSLRLTVNPSFWSDYVFEVDYKLMSIQQMDEYIKKHQHLPGVPSAKEVGENGIDVVNMEATLLKKIEELSLYVIQLQAQIDTLKATQSK